MIVKIDHALEFWKIQLLNWEDRLETAKVDWEVERKQLEKSPSEWFNRFICWVTKTEYRYKPDMWSDRAFWKIGSCVREIRGIQTVIDEILYQKHQFAGTVFEIDSRNVESFLRWWNERNENELSKLKEEYGTTDAT